METFVLTHEIGHIYSGHLKKASIKKSTIFNKDETIDVYQKSQAQEYEADLIALEFYNHIYKEHPTLSKLGDQALKAPLFFFSMAHLVEINLSSYDDYSTHPAAIDRLKTILANDLKSDPDSEDRKSAESFIEYVRTTPKFPYNT